MSTYHNPCSMVVRYRIRPIGIHAHILRVVRPYGTQPLQALYNISCRWDLSFMPLSVWLGEQGRIVQVNLKWGKFSGEQTVRRHVSQICRSSLSSSGKVARSGPLIVVGFNDGDALVVMRIFSINSVVGALSLSLFSSLTLHTVWFSFHILFLR